MFPTEGFQPTLSKLTAVLDRLRIRYQLTGGIATIAYGEPRMTQDVDLVLDRDRVLAVEDEFFGALAQAGLHFDEPTARNAIAAQQMFQLTCAGSSQGRLVTSFAPWSGRPARWAWPICSQKCSTSRTRSGSSESYAASARSCSTSFVTAPLASIRGTLIE